VDTCQATQTWTGNIPCALTNWNVDREDPAIFNCSTTSGLADQVIHTHVDPAQHYCCGGTAPCCCLGGYPHVGFYNYQGRKQATNFKVNEYACLSAYNFIPSSYQDSVELCLSENPSSQTCYNSLANYAEPSLWLQTNAPNCSYPVIGFTNQFDEPKIGIWDDNGNGNWHYVDAPICYDKWNLASIELDAINNLYSYYWNGAYLGSFSLATPPSFTGIDDVFIQTFNALDFPYDTYWSNINLVATQCPTVCNEIPQCVTTPSEDKKIPFPNKDKSGKRSQKQ